MTDSPVEVPGAGGGLGARILSLSARAEHTLSAHARTQRLVTGLPHQDPSPLRIALLGPYSAGKSMLVAALRRLPMDAVMELVDAAPTTHQLTEYPWNDATLVDLPGTLSGNDEDSQIARVGVRRADALMIVTTSELPGEAESKAILDALDIDGFADRSVVVVNKMNAENSDPDVLLEEVSKRLGSFATRVPVLPTDAKDYVDAINDPDLTDDQRDMLTAESGIDALAEALQKILAPGADHVRPRAQAFELVRLLEDAERQWDLAGEELRAAESTRKVEESISGAMEDVLRILERESDVVASVIRAAGVRIASSVSDKDASIPTDAHRDADQRRDQAMATFEAKLNSSIKSAFDALTAQYGACVPKPEPWINDLDPASTTIDGPPKEDSRLERATREAAQGGTKVMADLVAKVADGGGKGSMAEKVANQLIKSPAGRKVLDLGEKVTNGAGKFRPYGRIKATDKVVKVATKAQWALVVIGPALDLAGVLTDQIKRVKIDWYRTSLRAKFDEDALATQHTLAASGTQWVGRWILDVEQSLHGLSSRGADILAEREAALGSITSLREEADDLVRMALGS